MSLRPIVDVDGSCGSEEHFPPTYFIYPVGKYEWICPLCKGKTTFVIHAKEK